MTTYANLFYLGYLYNSLQNDKDKRLAKPKSTDWTGLNIVKRIQTTLNSLNIHDKTFENFLNEIEKRFNVYKEGEVIKDSDQKYIKDRMSGMWDNFVNDNLAGKILLTEREDLVFDLKKLHEGPLSFFMKGEIKKMTSNIENDLKDGMTSLIVGMWTPAVMITLRAVEGTLRKFYVKVTGKNFELVDKTFLNWGLILKELESFRPSINSELLDNLKYLKNKRNEAQHPQNRFTKDAAEGIFFKAMEAIRAMIKEL